MSISKKHPWADSFSTAIDPKIRKELKDAARLLALQVALEKADELITKMADFTEITSNIKWESELRTYRRARNKALKYLEDK